MGGKRKKKKKKNEQTIVKTYLYKIYDMRCATLSDGRTSYYYHLRRFKLSRYGIQNEYGVNCFHSLGKPGTIGRIIAFNNVI